jgi:uncharacterized protein
MIAVRLVVDTNVVVSAAIKPDGLQRTVLLLAITSPAQFYVSDAILAEYKAVLSRREFAIPRGVRQQVFDLIQRNSRLVKRSRRLQVASDPDDDKFIECADAARADFLITGNQRHFPKYWRQTKVITSREFVSLVAPHLTP